MDDEKDYALIRDKDTLEVFEIVDPNDSCSAYDQYCGGCGKCILMQTQYAILQGSSFEIVWVKGREFRAKVEELNWKKEGF